MSITVDTNDGESAVFDAISAKATCPVNRKRLDVGDFLIETEHGSIIVERKHVPDLISSIRDGRYRVPLIIYTFCSLSSYTFFAVS